jgi:D-alanine-D-alanine ligase
MPSPYPRIDSAEQFGKVAVLMGGDSAEREISLMSGQAVLEALVRKGIDAHPVDAAGDPLNALSRDRFDRVWLALHGRGGEDGTIQGLLTMMNMPFTGSAVLGCAISMDKLRTKRLLAGMGIDTPAYCEMSGEQDFESVIGMLGLPMIVKPAAEGSSLGMTRVEQAEQLAEAYREAARFRSEVFAEAWVSGPEFTATVLHNQVLPLIRIDAINSFYDYQAKYFSDETRYVCPCGLPEHQERLLAAASMDAFSGVGASGWGRVDFMLADDGAPLVLEVNTTPGMTTHSLVPMAAAETGIDFDELAWRILETSFTDRRSESDLSPAVESSHGA